MPDIEMLTRAELSSDEWPSAQTDVDALFDTMFDVRGRDVTGRGRDPFTIARPAMPQTVDAGGFVVHENPCLEYANWQLYEDQRTAPCVLVMCARISSGLCVECGGAPCRACRGVPARDSAMRCAQHCGRCPGPASDTQTPEDAHAAAMEAVD